MPGLLPSPRSQATLLLAGVALLLCACDRDVEEATLTTPQLPYSLLEERAVRPLGWPFLHPRKQFAVAEQGTLTVGLRHCRFRIGGDQRALVAPLDAFSLVVGEGTVEANCANADEQVTLRVLTCNGALEIAGGQARMELKPGLVLAISADHAADFLPAEANNPEVRVGIEAGHLASFAARGVSLTTPEAPVAADFTGRERYAREFEHTVVLVEDALSNVTLSFREGQELSQRLATATRQGNHEARVRASSLLSENARKQHRARELLRLRYGRLLACDLVREQRGLDIPALSAAYYPRVRSELGLP